MDIEALAESLFNEVKDFITRTFAPIMERLEKMETRISSVKDGVNGNSVSLDDVRPLIAEAVSKEVAAIPAAKDGASVSADDVLPALREDLRKAVSEIPMPEVPLEAIQAMVDQAVGKLPKAQDGKSIAVEDVLPALRDELRAAASSAEFSSEFVAALKAEFPDG